MTLEQLDRSIFEYMRVAAVSMNMLPDWRQITGSTPEAKQLAYEQAKTTLTDLTEVYSIGTAEQKGTKSKNRIIIRRDSIDMGTVSGSGQVGYEKNQDGSFVKYRYPDNTNNIVYEIRLITTTTMVERKWQNAIQHNFGCRRYIAPVNDTWQFIDDDLFLIENNGSANVSSTEFIEWIFTFTVKDVWIMQPVVLQANVPPLTSVNIKTYLNSFENSNFVSEINVTR